MPLDDLKERARAIDIAVGQIEKQFGKGSIMRLGQRGAIAPMEAISTGAISIDYALGIGGLPRGRVVEIFGPESSGKTTLALQVIAEAQKTGGMCRRERKAPTWSNIGIEVAPNRQVAPVRVIAAEQLWLLVVLFGADGLGDEGVAAVRSNHNLCTLSHRRSILRPSLDAAHTAILNDELLNREPLADLGARFRCGVDQELVEDGSPWTVRDRAVLRPRGARKRERAEIEGVPLNWGTSRCRETPEQPPSHQSRNPSRMHDVGRNRVARERCSIDNEHAIPLPREQHRRWRACTPRPDDNCVE